MKKRGILAIYSVFSLDTMRLSHVNLRDQTKNDLKTGAMIVVTIVAGNLAQAFMDLGSVKSRCIY